MQHRNAHIVWLCTWLIVGGCTAPGPSTTRHAAMHMERADRAAVFNAAELALAKLGYRIDRRDVSSGVLRAVPVSDAAGGQVVPRPARLSSRSGVRRVAEVRVEQVGDVVSVYCQVLVQEQTTQTHRLLAHDQRGYDAPTDTPIDREAATTTQQNTVWRTIRRDRDDERQILTAIADSATPPDVDAGRP